VAATARNLALILGNLFWRGLKLHHPGIDSLRLPTDVEAAHPDTRQPGAGASVGQG
jgi:hypothetical protein